MCRLSAFFGGTPICAADLVTRPSRSIITQSFDARERMTGDASTPAYLNGDGFGLGWYSSDRSDPIPCVYKHARPAWNDPNLGSIAEKVFTPVLFAHVRAASPGMDVSESTCHPFRYGRYLWMHNGGISNFAKIRRRLVKRMKNDFAIDFALDVGSSDSALCFAVFLDLVEDPMRKCTPEEIRRYLQHTIHVITEAIHEEGKKDLSLLNFVVSDGDTLCASRCVVHPGKEEARAASLYYACGNSYRELGEEKGKYGMVYEEKVPTMAIISSEPLTEERCDWVSVPQNCIVVVTKSIHIVISPIEKKCNDSISTVLMNLADSTGEEKETEREMLPHCNPRRKTAKWNRNDPFWYGSSGLSPCATCKSKLLLPLESPPLPNMRQKPPNLPPTPQSPRKGRTVFCVSLPKCTVLSMVVLGPYLYAGTELGGIHPYNLTDSITLPTVKTAHGAVMSLIGDYSRRLLISASSASTVCIWRINEDGNLHVLKVIARQGTGHIFSIGLINQTVYAGFSDTFARVVVRDVNHLTHPSQTNYQPALEVSGESETSEQSPTNDHPTSGANRAQTFALSDDEVYENAESASQLPMPLDISAPHFGFVFALAGCSNGKYLCTGCGDGVIRVWDRFTGACKFYRDGHSGAVLTLAVLETANGSFLFSGSRDRTIKVWDIDSGFLCKRTVRKHKSEIVFMSLVNDKLYSGSSDGITHVWCAQTMTHLGQVRDVRLQEGTVSEEDMLLFTAADGLIRARDISKWADKHTNRCGGLKSSQLPRATLKPNSDVSSQVSHVTAESTDEGTTTDEDTDIWLSTFGSNTGPNGVAEIPAASTELRGVGFSKFVGFTDEASISSTKRNSSVNGNDKFSNGSGELTDTSPESDGNSPENYVEDKRALGRVIGRRSAEKQVYRMQEERLFQGILSRFLSFPTVAGVEKYSEDCWDGARYIGTLLDQIGASVKYIPTASIGRTKSRVLDGRGFHAEDLKHDSGLVSTNPIVLAKFASKEPDAPTVTFYGHYDVMPADPVEWQSDPWTLTSVNGYYYGRGVSDNKGPILAMIYAIKALRERSRTGSKINIVLVLEGEGEKTNTGFRECIEAHKHWFQNTSLILTSNSYWLGENRPCINYGMRGVLELKVQVTGGDRNLHSGVDGGALFEPVNDLFAVVSTLVDSSGAACVVGFYDDVRPLSDDEIRRLQEIEFDVKEYEQGRGVNGFTSSNASDLLERRWRQPSISVTSLETSNTTGLYSVVPRQATAKLSIRYVPDQNPMRMEQAVRDHLMAGMKRRRSPNKLEVTCVNQGDWWLGDPNCEHFQVAARAIKSVWGVEPQYVCEGGSMPIFSFLSRTLDAPIVQVPLGQSSDNAHLPNERIRAMNLHRGKRVLENILEELSSQSLN